MKTSKFYHFCVYCGGTEITSNNWSLYNLNHTHYPGKDIPQKGWVNIESVSSSLWRFNSLQALKQTLKTRPDLLKLYEKTKKS